MIGTAVGPYELTLKTFYTSSSRPMAVDREFVHIYSVTLMETLVPHGAPMVLPWCFHGGTQGFHGIPQALLGHPIDLAGPKN